MNGIEGMEIHFMCSKLENRLIQYEKSTPISNDEELIKAIESIMDDEKNLPYEDRDFDLIDEAVDAILSLKGVDIGQLEEWADEIPEKHFSEIQTDETNFIKKSKTKSVKLKWLIPIAAIISMLVAGAIVAYALGYDLIEMTKKAYSQLVEKESYREGDHEIIITSDRREYYSLSEFLDNESYETLLLPFDPPEAYSVNNIQVNDWGEYTEISISLSNEKYVHTIIIKTPYISENSNNEEFDQQIGDYHVNYYQYDGIHQCDFIYEGNYYTVMSSSYNSLEILIESLRNSLQ